VTVLGSVLTVGGGGGVSFPEAIKDARFSEGAAIQDQCCTPCQGHSTKLGEARDLTPFATNAPLW